LTAQRLADSLSAVLGGDRSKRGGRGPVTVLTALALVAVLAPPASATPDPQAVQEQLNRTAAEYHRVEVELAITEDRIEKLRLDLASADRTIQVKTQALRSRAAFLYKTAPLPLVEGLLTAPNPTVFLKRFQLLNWIGEQDARLVEGIRMLVSRSDRIRHELESARERQRSLKETLRNKWRKLEVQLKATQAAARVARFGNFDRFTLPVLGGFAFSDSWGDRRSGGRRHQGTDVMAPCGVPVVAVTDGVITDMHAGGAGGIMLWLRAPNGDVFFYAHLQAYAPGVSPGDRVEVGEVIAYNGNTGNARGGACHVHFEWHPDGGGAVNPYPLLRAALG